MHHDDTQEPFEEDENEDTSPNEAKDRSIPDLTTFVDGSQSPDLEEKVGRAVDASAAEEEEQHRANESQKTDEDVTASGDSLPAESASGQDILSPSTDPYRGVALPAYYDAPQLVGVTVSAAGAETPEAVGLTDLGIIIRRNIVLLLMIVLIITGVSAIALQFVTPRYSATTSILFGSDVMAGRGSDSVLMRAADDEASIQSQVSLLTSGDLALRVIEKLGLQDIAEFASGVPTAVSNNGSLTHSIMNALEIFQRRLRVEHVPGTRVVSLTFSASDPQLASTTANTVAEAYIQDQRDAKFSAINDAAEWLTTQVSDLRRRVADSELEIEKFKHDSGIIDRGGITLSDQELSSLNGQLIESRARTVEALARLNQIRELLVTPSGIDSAAEVLSSNLIERLREQESVLLANKAELATELGSKHPRLLQIEAEVRQVRDKIDQEAAKIVDGLEYQYNVARSKERAIASSLASVTGQLEVSADAMVKVKVMERETAADRLLLETLLGRLKQVRSQLDRSLQEPDARIIARALTPIEPSFPKIGSLVALAAFASGLLAVMIVLVRELTDRTIRSEQQLVEQLKIKPFGTMPRITRRQLKGRTPFQYAVAMPRSRFAVAARAMVQKIQATGPNPGSNSSILMTTAPMHGEGKSNVALLLANSLALQGRTVMLIDADHFAPRLHEMVDLPHSPGLTEVLAGTVSIKDAVYAAATNSPFAFMPLGDRKILADGVPDYSLLRQTLLNFKKHFDHIVVNAPPVLSSNDALALGRMTDTSVLVMRWGKAHRRTAKNCAERLADAGCKSIGGVLTDVNMKKYELYEHGQSGIVTDRAETYYAN